MKKVTKKAIRIAIKKSNTTEIFRFAKISGIDTTKKSEVFRFAKLHCNTNRMNNMIYSIIYNSKTQNKYVSAPNWLVAKNINFAKQQTPGAGAYQKVLIKGNNNWYWCSQVYMHSDYNKSVAFEISDKNNHLAFLLNKLISKL